jgi:hypothetical protein
MVGLGRNEAGRLGISASLYWQMPGCAIGLWFLQPLLFVADPETDAAAYDAAFRLAASLCPNG